MEIIEFKEKLLLFIQKYNVHSWNWVPNQYLQEYVALTTDTCLHPDVNPSATASGLENDNATINAVLDLENEITNSLFFWTIFPHVYKNASFSLSNFDKYTDAFNRFTRLNVKLGQRQKCIDAVSPSSSRKETKKLKKTISKIKKNAIVYRGFSISRDEDVRVGRYKTNNPNAERQNAGLGFSFTTDRDTANFFATQYYIKRSETSGLGNILYWNFGSPPQTISSIPAQIQTDKVDDNARRVVASYLINQEDILFYAGEFGESEVVCLPDKARLIRYDFLNINQRFWHPSDRQNPKGRIWDR